MNRIQTLLAGLAGLLVVVLFWLLLWSPQQDELDELRAETEEIETEQEQTAARISALESVRDEAPQQEALLAAANTVIPREAGLAAFLRQLQQAADEAGMTLRSVSPSRPVPAGEEAAGLHRINVGVQLQGSYFQLVDFLRRVEDPGITPRAMLWNSVNIGGDPEEHPTLAVSLQGDLYAILPTPSADAPEDDGDAGEEDDEDDGDGEDEADVDVEVEE